MRKTLLGMFFTLAVMAAGWMMTGQASAGDLQGFNAPGAQSRVQPAEYDGGYSYCQRLRYRCLHKWERDEIGNGNCRRYREECGHRNYCQRLRYHCYNKERLGEEGEGNCRRYHRECGGY